MLLLTLFIGLLPLAAWSAGRMAIIIDDMGYSLRNGKAMLELPGEITYSFLPHAPYTPQLVQLAERRNKEIMVHLPMQDLTGKELDPGGLTLNMGRQDFFRTLLDSLDAVPQAVGANNHMGSLLTRHAGPMHWLMLGLKSYGDLFFIDSLTHNQSIALDIAQEAQVDSLARDVFLDHQRNPASIGRQFDQLLRIAQQRGQAIGIGHPYPETITVLRQKLANLPQSAVSLVKASHLLDPNRERTPLWHASSSPWPQAVKNSKPSP